MDHGRSSAAGAASRRPGKRSVCSSAPPGGGDYSIIPAQHLIASAANEINVRFEIVDTGHLIMFDQILNQPLSRVLMWISQSTAAATLDLQQVARTALDQVGHRFAPFALLRQDGAVTFANSSLNPASDVVGPSLRCSRLGSNRQTPRGEFAFGLR
jgi:hypothetical protein